MKKNKNEVKFETEISLEDFYKATCKLLLIEKFSTEEISKVNGELKSASKDVKKSNPKIKVGDYVRIETKGIIYISDECEKGLINNNYADLPFKCSNNILNLLEIGDIVNGYKIFDKKIENNKVKFKISTENTVGCWFDEDTFEIFSVLTSQQYNTNCLNIGGK